MKKIKIFLSTFLLILVSVISVYSEEKVRIISFYLDKIKPGQISLLSQLDVIAVGQEKIYAIVNQAEFRAVVKSKFSFNYESIRAFDKEIALPKKGQNGMFHSYRELEKDIHELEKKYPEIFKVTSIGTSIEGRNIYAIKISDNVSQDEKESEILFVGAHHAREWISVEVPYLLAHYLSQEYSSNPEIKKIVDSSEVWFVPLLNPDGLEYSINVYRYWRKNRRDNGNGTFGVDLNRNYGYMWGIDDKGSSPSTYSQVYRGKYPFSEPETAFLRDFMSQRKFAAAVSYHNYSQVILYPWGYTKIISKDRDLFHYLSGEMAKLITNVRENTYGYGQGSLIMYLTNGDYIDWVYGVFNIPSFTIELNPKDFISGGFITPESEIFPVFWENLPAALFLINWAVK
ncbi:MAG: M14 family metallopeptidase [Acidobacteriota bacterium]